MDDSKRTTSAGYRFPLSKFRPNSSDFHKACVPSRVQAVQTGDTKYKDSDYGKCDAVTQDTIWKQAVEVEKKATQQWYDLFKNQISLECFIFMSFK